MLLSWGKNCRKLLENCLGSFSLSQVENDLHRVTEMIGEMSLYVYINRRENALFQTTGGIHRLSGSL